MRMFVPAGILSSLLFAGCASSAAEIRPAYVSPLQFQNLTCQQIAAEVERLSRRVAEVSGVQDANKTSDAWATAGAIVISGRPPSSSKAMARPLLNSRG